VYGRLQFLQKIAFMPYTLKDSVRHKFTKNSDNVRDWAKYDEGLKNRGSLTIRFSENVIAAWNHVQPDKRNAVANVFIRIWQLKQLMHSVETAHRLKWCKATAASNRRIAHIDYAASELEFTHSGLHNLINASQRDCPVKSTKIFIGHSGLYRR